MTDKVAAREQRIAAAQKQKGDDKPPDKTPPQNQKEKAEATLNKDAERERLDAEKREGNTEKRSMDDPMRVLARRAVEIAESAGAGIGSAVTAPQAALIKERLGGDPLGKFAPAKIEGMLAYAQGGRGTGRDQLDAEVIEKLRTFSRESGSRRIWPRKVAAMVVALEEQRQGTALAPKKEAPAETAEAK
jgi:hypothetical protein